MSLLEFLFLSNNVLFTSAIILMLIIGILEGILILIGIGLSDMIDSFIPDFDSDLEIDVTGETTYSLTKFFGWIRLKEIPITMLLVIFLTSFGIIGLLLQAIIFNILNTFTFQIFIAIPSFILSLLCVRILGGIISRILPKDESSSISKDELIGYVATITLGKAKKGFPAEAKCIDTHGQTHYFMIEPENNSDIFQQGDKVLISGTNKTIFLAIKDLPEQLK